ncbi:DegV family protein [Gemella sp. GH3]|uniref:DegV family protein n=1 Tax=unclassified Gemella TaxID=2624949 RepID=UPI0015CFAC58|nr:MULTISPECIES: DegV family protein [unclassified Gemella]MBF0713213.1 DegV family protein [Gemella sp. GH3.1]NYS50165.1 DegV family protein [Gemella sp. GH3]
MAKIKIVTDSAADLTKEEIEKYNVEVIPLTVTIDDEEFENIDNRLYIEKMRTTDKFSTSQPAVGKFYEIYEKWTKQGYSVISIHISDVISGTVNTAMSVAAEFDNVYVINSKSASSGTAYFVKDCAKCISEGMQVLDIVNYLNNKVNKVITYITIDNLNNLVKGGRIKKTAGLIGSLLNIKILAKSTDKELTPLEKVRGKKKLVQALISNMSADIKNQTIKTISLPHALSFEYVELIKTAIYENFNYKVKDEDIFVTTPIISTHTGEGAVGVLIELA